MTEIKAITGINTPTPVGNTISAPILTPQQQLKILKQQQAQLNQWLVQVNNKLYEIETQYLDDTPLGNIIRGWDIDGKTAPPSYRSKNNIDDRERMFSFSSLAFMQDKKASLANPSEKIAISGPSSKSITTNPTGTTSNKGRKRKRMKDTVEEFNNYEDY